MFVERKLGSRRINFKKDDRTVMPILVFDKVNKRIEIQIKQVGIEKPLHK